MTDLNSPQPQGSYYLKRGRQRKTGRATFLFLRQGLVINPHRVVR